MINAGMANVRRQQQMAQRTFQRQQRQMAAQRRRQDELQEQMRRHGQRRQAQMAAQRRRQNAARQQGAWRAWRAKRKRQRQASTQTITVAAPAAPSEQQPWWLVGSDHSRQPVPLVGMPVVIGRSQAAPYDLGKPAELSKTHVEIGFSDHAPYIADLGSTNGTRLNGRSITESEWLQPGDRLEVGSVTLEVYASE
jgi:hypothetical protein